MERNGGTGNHLRSAAAAAAIVRITLGGVLLISGVNRWGNVSYFIETLGKALTMGGDRLSPPHYVTGISSFLNDTLKAHTHSLAWILILTSVVLGLLLLMGLCTRLVATLALLHGIFILLITPFGDTTSSLGPDVFTGRLLLIIMALTTLIAAAGRTWGLDALLARNKRIPWLW
jgi:uncharacterized membrane protein YphA (DoxX/SURF4 family)